MFKPTNGWYSRKGEDKKYRLADTDTKEFWMTILKQKSFIDFVKNKYQVATGEILKDDDISKELDEIDTEDINA